MSFVIENWIVECKKNDENAWQSFLTEYNNLILKILQHLTRDYDNKMDSYTYVLCQLKAQNFRKICAFLDKDREYPFEQWLAVIVRNCFFDWVRETKGRRRFPKKIREMSETYQVIYRFLYWEEFPLDIIYEIVKAKDGNLMTFEQFLEKVEKVQLKGGSEKVNKKVRIVRRDHANDWMIDQEASKKQISPEDSLLKAEVQKIFLEALEKLTVQEKLVLKLHFKYGRTLEDIRSALKLSSIWKVHRLLKKAINKLA